MARLPLVIVAVTALLMPVCSQSCPSGWTVAADDGNEGHDSCLKLFLDNNGITWSGARDACVTAGGHLFTVRNTNKNSALLATAAALSTSTPFFIGLSQSSSATLRNTGWSWVDGTDAGNVNCGSGADGCGLWGTNYPKCVPCHDFGCVAVRCVVWRVVSACSSTVILLSTPA